MKNLEIKEYKNKYKITAEEIHTLLGENNYLNVYNCMTRFRAKIIDKKLVDIDKIKTLSLIKGIHWNGDELQIIIGGEVIKVIDEFKKYEQELLSPIKQHKDKIVIKKSIGARIMAAITGIITPIIPLLMASGLLMALYNVLTLPGNEVLKNSIQTGIDEKGNAIMTGIGMNTLYLFDIWSSLFFIMSLMILSSLGLYFIYSVTRYFKGNVWLALLVGVTLMCRGFFPALAPSTTSEDWINTGFGDWITGVQGKTGFLLFKLGDFPVIVGGYEGAIIPYVVGGFLVVYIDKWIKKWMPSSVDIIFRAALAYIIVMFGLWFLLAPISNLIEFGLVISLQWLGDIPYGIGTGIMGLLWQPLVITGTHHALGASMMGTIASGHPLALRAATSIAVWSQLGSVIGVAITSKNMTLKKVAWGTVPAGIFGITEPIIYGVNLPKIRPFLFGCIGGMIGGFLSGILKITVDLPPADGVFTILAFTGGVKEILFVLLTWIVAMTVGCGLVVLFYSERKNEYSYFHKGINKLIKLTNQKETVNQEFEQESNLVKAMKDNYKKMSKYYSEISRYEQAMIFLENKESKAREKMYNKLIKLKAKLTKKENNELLEKFNQLNEQYSTYSLDKEKEKVQLKIDKLNSSNTELIKTFNQNKTNIYTTAIKTVEHYQDKNNKNELKVIENIFYNALNSVEIGYGIEDAKPTRFKKESE